MCQKLNISNTNIKKSSTKCLQFVWYYYFYRITIERTRRASSLPRQKPSRFNRPSNNVNRISRNFDGPSSPSRKISTNSTLPRTTNPQNNRGFSLDRKREPRDTVEIEMDPILLDNTPILCNKYVVGKNEGFVGPIPGKGKSIPDSFLWMLSRRCLEQLGLQIYCLIMMGNNR